MEPPVELSRSFKRRQRRKKQLERRRHTDGGGTAGSSADEHESSAAAERQSGPSEGSAPSPAARAASAAAERQGGPPERRVPSPAARAASAAAGVPHKRSGRGRPRRDSRPEGDESKSAGVSAAAVPPQSAARESAERGQSEAVKAQDKPQNKPAAEAVKPQDKPVVEAVKPQDKSAPEAAAYRDVDISASSETAGRPKSGSSKRRKRKSTGPSSGTADGPPAEPAPGPAPCPGQRTEPASSPPDACGSSGAAERVSPSAGAAGSPAGECGAGRAGPAPRRETSPVVSSTEEVLRSVRALQTVLGELRTGLLAAPPPPPPARQAAVKQAPAPTQTPALAPASATAPASAPAPAPAPSPTLVSSSAPAPAPATAPPPAAAMSPPSAAGPAAGTAGEEPQKTKEQIKAERKAKAEAAKLAKAAKAGQKKQQAAAAAAPGGDGSPAGGAGGDKPQAAAEVSGKAAKPAEPAAKPASRETAEGPVKAAKPAEPAADDAEKPAAGEKSKAELKAERRAKQEAQRAAKAAATAAGPAAKPVAAAKPAKSAAAAAGPQTTPAAGHPQDSAAKADRKSTKKTAERTGAKKGLQMFSHLLQFDASIVDALTAKPGVHRALVPFLLRLADGRLSSSNAGAVALLAALAELVDQYNTPAQRELRRDLPDLVRREVVQLARRRPLSVAMENVAHRLEQVIRQDTPADKGDYEAKQFVIQWIENFIQDNISKAMTAITQYAGEKIMDDDVILTYGRSTTVLDVLSTAQRDGRRFRVIVVDSRPRLEGRDMLQQLLDAGVPCSYGVLTAISHHMKEATKVLLGAHALLSNGMVLAAAGTALVSLTGRALNRPVLVCCETYKFSDRVQTDSQVYNQLGNPDELVTSPDSPLADWRHSESLSLLNLTYDVTPPELVDVVVTELGAIPCTSVPAVLRLQQAVVY